MWSLLKQTMQPEVKTCVSTADRRPGILAGATAEADRTSPSRFPSEGESSGPREAAEALAAFDEAGVHYLVLRDFVGLVEGRNDVAKGSTAAVAVRNGKPDTDETKPDTDQVERNQRVLEIDLLVERRDWKRFRQTACSLGFRVQRPRVVRPLKRMLVRYADGRLVKLDVHLALVNRGLVTMDSKWALARRERRGGLWRLAPEDEAAHLVCHAILDSGRVAPKYAERLERLIDAHGDDKRIAAGLRSFGADRLWFEVVSDFERYRDDAAACESLRQRSIRRIAWRRPGNLWRRLRREVDRRLARLRGRRGVVVAVLGPDGVGKSTLLRSLSGRLTEMRYMTDVVYMGPWGQSILPVSAARRVIGRPGEPSRKLGWFPAASLRWVAYLAVLAAEFAARWLFRARPARRRADIVLCDRYLYDVLVGYKNRVSPRGEWMRTVLCRVYPRPHATVLLCAPAEAVAERKDQLSTAAAGEVAAAYERAAKRVNMIKIDASQSSQAVEEAVLEALWPVLFCGGLSAKGEAKAFSSRAEDPRIARLVAACPDGEDVRRAVQRHASTLSGKESRWVCEELLDPSRSIGALLLSLPAGAEALVVGDSLGAMSRGVSAWGPRVVHLTIGSRANGDVGLRFRRRLSDCVSTAEPSESGANVAIEYVQAEDGARLPFDDGRFDAVIVDSLPQETDGAVKWTSREFLKELRRVVSVEGQLLMSVRNRRDYRRWLGKRDADEDGAANQISLDREEFVRRLREAGWKTQELFAPLPSPRRISQLALLDRQTPVRPPRRRRSRVKSWLHKVAFRPSVFQNVAPYFMALAGSIDDRPAARQKTGLMDQLWDRLELVGDWRARPLHVSRMGVAVARGEHHDGHEVVVRIPMSAAGQARVERNWSALRQLSEARAVDGGLQACTPRPVNSILFRGRQVTVETFLSGQSLARGESRSAARAWRDVLEMSGLLSRVGGEYPLFDDVEIELSGMASADSARKCQEPLERVLAPLRKWFAENAEWEPLVHHLEATSDWLGDRLTIWTPAHGDCHPGNVLVDRAGRVTGVVDWDRGLACEPFGLDPLKFAIRTSGDGGRDPAEAPWPLRPLYQRDLMRLFASRELPTDYLEALRVYYALRLAAEQVWRPIVSRRQSHWAETLVERAAALVATGRPCRAALNGLSIS